MFFKSFLELDGANMVSILSFDNMCTKNLLGTDDPNLKFQNNMPVFYKLRIKKRNNKEKYYYVSALDISLKNN